MDSLTNRMTLGWLNNFFFSSVFLALKRGEQCSLVVVKIK